MSISAHQHTAGASPDRCACQAYRRIGHADAAQPGTGGNVRLFANGNEIGKGRMDHSVPLRFSGYVGMDIGRDNGGVVDRTYADKAPFAFTGTVKKVVFDIKPHLSADDDQALHESAHHGHVAHGISG